MHSISDMADILHVRKESKHVLKVGTDTKASRLAPKPSAMPTQHTLHLSCAYMLRLSQAVEHIQKLGKDVEDSVLAHDA